MDVAYARADKMEQRLGNPLGQDIWGGLSFGYFSLTTQRKVTRHQTQQKLKRINEAIIY
jgi:hypothetical protein